MEENSNQNQPIQDLTEFFRDSEISPIFRGLYFKIYFELDKTPNTKFVALSFTYKFSFDQNSSSVQKCRDNSV